MKLSTGNLGHGPRLTAFQDFMETYDLLLVTVKVQCPECGHAWGIKIDDFDSSVDIPEKRFKCTNCGHYQAKGLSAEDAYVYDGTGDRMTDWERSAHIRKENSYIKNRTSV